MNSSISWYLMVYARLCLLSLISVLYLLGQSQKKKILRPDYVPGAVLGLGITGEKQISLVFTRSRVRQTT